MEQNNTTTEQDREVNQRHLALAYLLLALLCLTFFYYNYHANNKALRDTVCSGNAVCPLTVKINNTPEGFPATLNLDFNNRTKPALDGSWTDVKSYPFLFPPEIYIRNSPL